VVIVLTPPYSAIELRVRPGHAVLSVRRRDSLTAHRRKSVAMVQLGVARNAARGRDGQQIAAPPDRHSIDGAARSSQKGYHAWSRSAAIFVGQTILWRSARSRRADRHRGSRLWSRSRSWSAAVLVARISRVGPFRPTTARPYALVSRPSRCGDGVG